MYKIYILILFLSIALFNIKFLLFLDAYKII